MLQDTAPEGSPGLLGTLLGVTSNMTDQSHADGAQRGWPQATTRYSPLRSEYTAAQGRWVPGDEPAGLVGPEMPRDQGLGPGASAPAVDMQQGRPEDVRELPPDKRRHVHKQQMGEKGLKSVANVGGMPAWVRELCLALRRGAPLPLASQPLPSSTQVKEKGGREPNRDVQRKSPGGKLAGRKGRY